MNRKRLPELVESALIHYQFETIHPFADGNGRVGRMLITLHLLMRSTIKTPVLYLSPTLETRKDEYIDRMFEVSRSGAWLEWIRFYLKAVADAAESAIATAARLFALQRHYRERVQKAGRSANLIKIIDYLFVSPAVTIPELQTVLDVTYRSAQLNVASLIKVGILNEVPGPSNPKMFVAMDILDVIADRKRDNA